MTRTIQTNTSVGRTSLGWYYRRRVVNCSRPTSFHKNMVSKVPGMGQANQLKNALASIKENLRALPVHSISIAYYQLTSLKNHLTLSGNNVPTTDQRTSPRKSRGLLITRCGIENHGEIISLSSNPSYKCTHCIDRNNVPDTKPLRGTRKLL